MLENVSLDAEATVTNAEGAVINAKDLVCENKAVVIATLEAAKAMVKNPIARTVVNLAVNLIEHIVETLCAK